ncbi:MAG: hypothetical protein H7321_04160 [Bacteroidia bacterium]|nr:hypothetical protein [Bacteroidia bacterium]
MKLQKYENIHIPMWLVKDLCWLMKWKAVGMFMAFPTVIVAFIIAYFTRKDKSCFLTNLSVCAWILANSTWMFGEFFGYEKYTLPLSFGLFSSGILIYLLFIVLQYRKKTL